ncbi:hypothetical protein JCM16303_005247 [Sporobolomyces ruberrimus]
MPSIASLEAPLPVIYGTSTLQHSPLAGSPSALQRSQDGQYAIVTREAIHLLTPQLPTPTRAEGHSKATSKENTKGKGKGKQSEPTTTPRQVESIPTQPRSRPRPSHSHWTFSCTNFTIPKKNILKWSDWVDDSEISTNGQLDPTWRSASFSPSGLSSSKLGGCLLATLTTNAEAYVYEAGKDAANGEWQETFDITSRIVNDLVTPSKGTPQLLFYRDLSINTEKKELKPDALLLSPDMPKVTSTNSHIRREISYLLLRAQASCISWSKQISSSSSSSSSTRRGDLDGSILAVGHRSGEVSLWRYGSQEGGEGGGTRCLVRFRGGGRGEVGRVLGLEWSEWRWDGERFVARVAISDSGGRVWVRTITQILPTSRPRPEGEGEDIEMNGGSDKSDLEVDYSDSLEVVEVQDRRTVSQFRWIGDIPARRTSETEEEGQAAEKKLRLVYAKLGTVNVVEFNEGEADKLEVEKNDEIDLELPSGGEGGNGNGYLWSGSSNWSSCSGLTYQPTSNSLLIHLSCSLIYELPLSLSMPPTLLPSSTYTRASRTLYDQITNLHRKTQSQQVQKEPENEEPDEPESRASSSTKSKLPRNEGARVLGVVPLVGSVEGEGQEGGRGQGEFAYVFETVRPDFFTYRPPSTMKTFFAIVGAPRTPTEEHDEGTVLSHVERLMDKEETSSLYIPPAQALLPLLDSFLTLSSSLTFVSCLLDILSRPFLPATTPFEESDRGREDDSIESRVISSLYGENGLERLRQKSLINGRLSILPDLPQVLKARVEATKVSIERELIRSVVGRLAGVLSKTKDLSDSEKPFLARLLLASSALPRLTLPSESTTSSDEAGPTTLLEDAETLSTAFESSSNCPACQTSIPFGNIRNGVCLNGHTWERCSITLEIISRVDVRTCRECQRKAFTKVSAPKKEGQERGNEDNAEVERVNRVLRGVRCCAYCGGRWIKVR